MDDERPDESEQPEATTKETPVTKEAPTTKEAPVTKVTPIVTEAEAQEAAADAAAVDEPTPAKQEFDVSLGPLFTLGAVLVLLGVLRRRPLAFVAGIGAIWLDQRSDVGRRLKEQIRARGIG